MYKQRQQQQLNVKRVEPNCQQSSWTAAVILDEFAADRHLAAPVEQYGIWQRAMNMKYAAAQLQI
jgi:hypothetical protein